MTMKFLGSLALLLLAACAPRPIADEPGCVDRQPRADESRAFVDRLRVDTSWHPPSTGGQVLTCSYELPEGAYVAQGWPCWAYRSCEWGRSVRWSRSCRPIPRWGW